MTLRRSLCAAILACSAQAALGTMTVTPGSVSGFPGQTTSAIRIDMTFTTPSNGGTGTVTINLSSVGAACTPPTGVGGMAASGTAKVGSPVQMGGVFNTVQPTVTTGQVVEAASTARGAMIVATGAENVVIVGAGVAGTPSGGVVSVQGVASGTNLPVSQATASSLNVRPDTSGATASSVPARANFVGARAAVALPTAVTVGQEVGIQADIAGKPVVKLNSNRERVVQNQITLSATTETTLIAAGAAGVFRDMTAVILTNTSATTVRVDIRDATAGTVRFQFDLGVAGTASATQAMVFPVPATQATAANNWTAQLSAAVTDVRIWAQSIETN